MYDLARLLDPARYVPIALFYENNPFVERLRLLGIEVITWEAEWQREHGRRARWFSPRRLLGLAGAVARRVSLLKEKRIDLVHINNSPSYSYYDWLPAARLRGIPCITHLRGELYPSGNALVHWLNCRFDRYIAISTYIRKILEHAKFPRERIVQIEDGVDIDAIRRRVKRSRAEVREELGVGPDVLLAIMVGHLRVWKGQDVVLKALAGLEPRLRSRVSVAFAGAEEVHDDSFRRGLEEFARAHQLESCVRFLGLRDDVPDLLNAADVVLHASTRPEPFGLVVVEGMSFGRLVIAAALGGPLEIVGDGSGWVFDPNEPGQLATLLRRVIENPALATQNAAAAISRAAEFSVQRTATRVQRVYDEHLA